MAKERLNLHLLLVEGREHECAAAMQQQLRPGQWRLVCQLAAELVSRWETVNSGQRIVVVPAQEAEASIARHLRLRPVSEA